MNVDELSIMNVLHFVSTLLRNQFILRFEIDGFRYNLLAQEEEDGLVHPRKVYHFDKESGCRYCEGKEWSCLELNKYKDQLFQRLIQFPSIRLEWVYIDHV